MRNQSSNHEPSDGGSATLSLPIPIRDEGVFKHRASPHILNFLADNPELDVSIRQLSTVTPVTERATREAVDALEGNDLISTFHEGTARRVHINRIRLSQPNDPIERIPQVAFRTAVRVGRAYVKEELDSVRGIVLFGSVARGDADRQSDIDLWIVVDADLMEQRNRAARLSKNLRELPIPETIPLDEISGGGLETRWEEIRSKLEAGEWDRADTHRHDFDFVLETPKSILGQSDRVESERLFGDGITIYATDDLDSIKRAILTDE